VYCIQCINSSSAIMLCIHSCCIRHTHTTSQSVANARHSGADTVIIFVLNICTAVVGCVVRSTSELIISDEVDRVNDVVCVLDFLDLPVMTRSTRT